MRAVWTGRIYSCVPVAQDPAQEPMDGGQSRDGDGDEGGRTACSFADRGRASSCRGLVEPPSGQLRKTRCRPSVPAVSRCPNGVHCGRVYMGRASPRAGAMEHWYCDAAWVLPDTCGGSVLGVFCCASDVGARCGLVGPTSGKPQRPAGKDSDSIPESPRVSLSCPTSHRKTRAFCACDSR